MTLLPGWLRSYRRAWLGHDVVAGLIIWGVVTPQAVAYAQIAGLPPQAGLIAAPGAMIGYAILGSSRTLVVSATTATSALSAAAVAPLAHGDSGRFAALSAALALVTAAVLVCGGLLRVGAITDFVSKPVITGFLFGLGMFVAVSQLPTVFGVPAGSGQFFHRLADLVSDLGDTQVATLVVGLASIAGLLVLRARAPRVPGTLVVLVASIVVSGLLGLDGHGVDVVGKLPDALPKLALPDVGWGDLADLLPAALGVLILSTEAMGVARALAVKDGYTIDVNRELYALGSGNLLAGLSSGFVQSGGASQTAAAEEAGGKTQLATVVAACLILLTGAFLTSLFENLPQATLAAIVIVAVSGFLRVDELRRFARLRRSALVTALIALAGVLLFGVLQGLIVAAVLTLVDFIRRLSRPVVGLLARDPESGAWGRPERHPTWTVVPGILVVSVDGPLWYANCGVVKERLLGLVAAGAEPPRAVVVDLRQSDLDVGTLDMLDELADALERDAIELVLADVRARPRALLARSGLAGRVRIEPTLDAAAEPHVASAAGASRITPGG